MCRGGDASGSTNPLTVQANANQSIQALFTVTLTTSTAGPGHGSVGASPNQATYAYGSTVTLTATPQAGYSFTNWSGESDVWTIEDGTLHADTTKTPGQHHIYYMGPNAVMKDFDLKVEFKISADGQTRGEIMQLADIFRGRTIDVSNRTATVELTGTRDKIEAFERMVRPFGLIEMVRTGEIAIARGRSQT